MAMEFCYTGILDQNKYAEQLSYGELPLPNSGR